MYYITNHTDQIIAADDLLLNILNVENIEALSKQLILEQIRFTPLTETSMSIVTQEKSINFEMQTSTLSSLMGNFTLVHLDNAEEEEVEVEVEDTSIFTLNEETLLEEDSILPEEKVDDSINEIKIENDDDLIFIKDSLSLEEDKETDTNTLKEISPLDNQEEPFTHNEENELFDLTIPKEPVDTIEEITLDTIQTPQTEEPLISKESHPQLLDTTPIVIDLDQVSQSIGISNEDYTTFLNEYIDTAISLESDLQSTQTEQRSSAINTLTQLADVLQLPSVNDIMANLATLSPDNSKQAIESFYATISRFTTQKDTLQNKETHDTVEPSIQEDLILIDKPLKTEEKSKESFGTIDLSDVKPIHFDFQLEEAANDLSLPVELIEEFVHDFIEQAHVETEKMLTAYEKGDLGTIQKIGHLLKGASSNLRINPLSDTLYEIQFCEDSSNLEALIKQYWGQFLAFEQQIDILSK
ncbi:MAG TPA: hypothetical protein ENK98_01005 [Epsilonproteobacteria bacterium]|nr:hypothetical protein [Campylobacterota bacterium]